MTWLPMLSRLASIATAVMLTPSLNSSLMIQQPLGSREQGRIVRTSGLRKLSLTLEDIP
jgi:hypothetical protein